jgi:hypothetical protein
MKKSELPSTLKDSPTEATRAFMKNRILQSSVDAASERPCGTASTLPSLGNGPTTVLARVS